MKLLGGKSFATDVSLNHCVTPCLQALDADVFSAEYTPRNRAVFTHGPRGPGPRAENFQGRHILKKNRD
jgi:hypothetical protein